MPAWGADGWKCPKAAPAGSDPGPATRLRRPIVRWSGPWQGLRRWRRRTRRFPFAPRQPLRPQGLLSICELVSKTVQVPNSRRLHIIVARCAGPGTEASTQNLRPLRQHRERASSQNRWRLPVRRPCLPGTRNSCAAAMARHLFRSSQGCARAGCTFPSSLMGGRPAHEDLPRAGS